MRASEYITFFLKYKQKLKESEFIINHFCALISTLAVLRIRPIYFHSRITLSALRCFSSLCYLPLMYVIKQLLLHFSSTFLSDKFLDHLLSLYYLCEKYLGTMINSQSCLQEKQFKSFLQEVAFRNLQKIIISQRHIRNMKTVL